MALAEAASSACPQLVSGSDQIVMCADPSQINQSLVPTKLSRKTLTFPLISKISTKAAHLFFIFSVEQGNNESQSNSQPRGIIA
jgi:hypothetical protein